ncbi:MAG: hypothetical protein LQ343_007459 [Gyalolechia ehrenbergii]|nr:MAG: hypothetical protein LQ343_007459 [Gyalolechia ehrenbergii]
MGKVRWDDAKKGARTEKPDALPLAEPVDLRAQAQSTKKTGTAYRRLMDRLHKKDEKMNKEKTDRGEERPPRRTHHCVQCKKPFNSVCAAKGHMVPCDDHPLIHTRPGKPCASCILIKNSALTRAKNEKEDEIKRMRKSDLDNFLSIIKGRKKERAKPTAEVP